MVPGISINTFVAGVWGGVYCPGSSVLGFFGTVCSSAINRNTYMASLTD